MKKKIKKFLDEGIIGISFLFVFIISSFVLLFLGIIYPFQLIFTGKSGKGKRTKLYNKLYSRPIDRYLDWVWNKSKSINKK